MTLVFGWSYLSARTLSRVTIHPSGTFEPVDGAPLMYRFKWGPYSKPELDLLLVQHQLRHFTQHRAIPFASTKNTWIFDQKLSCQSLSGGFNYLGICCTAFTFFGGNFPVWIKIYLIDIPGSSQALSSACLVHMFTFCSFTMLGRNQSSLKEISLATYRNCWWFAASCYQQ